MTNDGISARTLALATAMARVLHGPSAEQAEAIFAYERIRSSGAIDEQQLSDLVQTDYDIEKVFKVRRVAMLGFLARLRHGEPVDLEDLTPAERAELDRFLGELASDD